MRLYLQVFSLFLFFTITNSNAQNKTILCELHNLNVDNKSENKIIHIRFLNCSKSDFFDILQKIKAIDSFKEFRNNYSEKFEVGEVYLTKKSTITTTNIKDILETTSVKNILFNGKIITVNDLSMYNFSEVERNNHTDNNE